MNPPNTSREEIMRVSRKIVSEKGLPALNMRALAKECGIALGTLYNYYSDKDELVVAAIESVWQDILEKSAPQGTHYYGGPSAKDIGVVANPRLWFKAFRTGMSDELFETIKAFEPE